MQDIKAKRNDRMHKQRVEGEGEGEEKEQKTNIKDVKAEGENRWPK